MTCFTSMEVYIVRIDRLKLKLIMTKADVTQMQLAEKTGISRASINAVCQGKSCRQETADKIAKALKVKVEELI